MGGRYIERRKVRAREGEKNTVLSERGGKDERLNSDNYYIKRKEVKVCINNHVCLIKLTTWAYGFGDTTRASGPCDRFQHTAGTPLTERKKTLPS